MLYLLNFNVWMWNMNYKKEMRDCLNAIEMWIIRKMNNMEVSWFWKVILKEKEQEEEWEWIGYAIWKGGVTWKVMGDWRGWLEIETDGGRWRRISTLIEMRRQHDDDDLIWTDFG